MFSRQGGAADLAKSLAVDAMAANVMVADASLTIVYINRALSEFFSAAEADIRKDLPSFSASKLVGQSMDLFQKNQPRQRRFLGAGGRCEVPFAGAERFERRVGAKADSGRRTGKPHRFDGPFRKIELNRL